MMLFIEFIINRRMWDWWQLARYVGVIGRLYISTVIGSVIYVTFLRIHNRPEDRDVGSHIKYIGYYLLTVFFGYVVGLFPVVIGVFNTFGGRTQLTLLLLLILYSIGGVVTFIIYRKRKWQSKIIKIGIQKEEWMRNDV